MKVKNIQEGIEYYTNIALPLDYLNARAWSLINCKIAVCGRFSSESPCNKKSIQHTRWDSSTDAKAESLGVICPHA